MPEPPPSHHRLVGTTALVLGAVALVGYTVLGASPASPGLPTVPLALSALLVVAGGALREGRGPLWIEFVTGALIGLLAYDVIDRLLV